MPTSTATHTATPTETSTPKLHPCIGDCDDNGNVTVDEIITLVNIAFGAPDVSGCASGDRNGEGVDITLIVKAVGYALTSCPAE